MSGRSATVYVVDDEPAVLRGVTRLLRSAGWSVAPHKSPEEFLAACDPEVPGCAVLDLSMPGMGGLEVQRRLSEAGHERPVVFLTGLGDVTSSVRALKAGAVDFLEKPVVAAELLAAVEAAVAKDLAWRQARLERAELRARYEFLTPRERQVMRLVAAGHPNKVIASALGTVEKTVKVHRGRVMEKMGAESLPALVRMAMTLGLNS